MRYFMIKILNNKHPEYDVNTHESTMSSIRMTDEQQNEKQKSDWRGCCGNRQPSILFAFIQV